MLSVLDDSVVVEAHCYTLQFRRIDSAAYLLTINLPTLDDSVMLYTC